MLTNANTSGNISRKRHPKKEVEAALEQLEAQGVRVDVRENGHVWARLLCSCPDRQHQTSVHSTPQNPGNHAKALLSTVIRWTVQHQEAERAKRKGDEKR